MLTVARLIGRSLPRRVVSKPWQDDGENCGWSRFAFNVPVVAQGTPLAAARRTSARGREYRGDF